MPTIATPPTTSPAIRRARLFRNGRNQALRIPRDLELPGHEVTLYREGNRLVVEPVTRVENRLVEFLRSLPPEGIELPEIEDPPVEPEEIF